MSILQLALPKVAQPNWGSFGLESAIDFDTPSGTNARRPSKGRGSIYMERILKIFRRLQLGFFSLILHGIKLKFARSSLLWKILNVFMHYLPVKKLTHSNVSGNGPDWLTGIIVNHGPDLTNKYGSYFLIKTISVIILSCRTFITTIALIRLFLHHLHYPQIDTQTQWNLRSGASGVNACSRACLFRISGGVNCIMVQLSTQILINWLLFVAL